jgi:hypothetical protein
MLKNVFVDWCLNLGSPAFVQACYDCSIIDNIIYNVHTRTKKLTLVAVPTGHSNDPYLLSAVFEKRLIP